MVGGVKIEIINTHIKLFQNIYSWTDSIKIVYTCPTETDHSYIVNSGLFHWFKWNIVNMTNLVWFQMMESTGLDTDLPYLFRSLILFFLLPHLFTKNSRLWKLAGSLITGLRKVQGSSFMVANRITCSSMYWNFQCLDHVFHFLKYNFSTLLLILWKAVQHLTQISLPCCYEPLGSQRTSLNSFHIKPHVELKLVSHRWKKNTALGWGGGWLGYTCFLFLKKRIWVFLSTIPDNSVILLTHLFLLLWVW